MSSRLAFAAALTCGLVALSPVAAQSLASQPQTVVVTAGRAPQPLAQVPLDLSVITREQIDRAGAAGLAELLQRLAGVEISAAGGPGQPSGVFLRGSNTGHVVVLVDGVRVGSATTGTTALEHLPLAAIDRIEVLQGPASGLYGADAIGGVIQVFTRREGSAHATLAAGSHRERQAAAGVGRLAGATRWTLEAGIRRVDAPSATTPDNVFSYDPDRDPYRRRHAAGFVEHDLTPGLTLALRGQASDARTHFDAVAGGNDVNEQQLSTFSGELRHRIADGWTQSLRLARGRDALSTTGSFPGRFATEQDQASWQHDVAVAGGRLAAGLEWRDEQVASDTAFTETRRRTASAFGGYARDEGALQWQAALRHDRNAQFGGRTSGNLGAQWRVADGLALTAAAGSAFKAPSFNDLYYPLAFGYQGNPALRPERSVSGELGLRWQAGGASASLVLFDNRIRDLIAINGSFSSVENIARARIRGAVVRGAWRDGPLALRAGLTLQRPRDEATGARLVRRADRFGSLGADWIGGAWNAGVEVVAVGDRFDDGANSVSARLGGHGLVNLRAGYAPAPGWRVDLRVDNAADKIYTLVRGYATEGRRWLLTLGWQGV